MKITKKTSEIVETCERVSKISIFILVFLLPILFLPWTANVLDFTKQALLVVLVFVSIFAWLLKIMISGKGSFNLSLIHIPIGLLFLVYLVSTIFSLWRYGSFWGWPQLSSESLLSLLCLVFLYILVSNIFEKKEIFYLLATLVVSSSLAMLYAGLQIFGKFLIPVDFTRTTSFNTIGGMNNLAILAAGLLPLIIFLIIASKDKRFRILFIAAAIINTGLLLLINFAPAWWLVVLGTALIIAFGGPKRDIFDSRWIPLPMFFLALALLFSLFRFQIPVPLSSGTERPLEVFLKQKASFDIVWQTLKQSPVIGTGPGTFIYNFSKYKDISFNQDPFWNVRFEWASSKALTVLGTTGVLGALSFLVLIGFFIFYGIKFLFGKIKKDIMEGEKDFWLLVMGIFVSFLTISFAFFLYQSNLTLDFSYFLLMGGLVALSSKTRKEFLLKPSSLVALGLTFAFTLVFVFGLGIIILEGQRYFASLSYLKGIKIWQKGNTEEALKHLQGATRINPGVDFYWRELAQVYIQNIQAGETTQKLQVYVANAVNSAKAATDSNLNNVANWSVRGFIYQNLIGIVGGTKDWAVNSYQEALKLEPTNPYFPTQAGISILREVSRLAQDQKQEREKLISEAREQFEKAIGLKSDYAPAHFQLAKVYQAQGRTAEMAGELERAKNSDPFDVGLAFQLGLIYFQAKDYQKAKTELERAVLLSPDYANALYFLGLTYDELGEKENAIKAFERIQVNNLDNQIVKQVLANLRTGQKALKGIIEEQPPEAPIKEEHPEIEE